MPAVTVTAAVGAKRRGSAGSGLGTGSRLAGAGSEESSVKKTGLSYGSRWWWRCSERPAGAKAAVATGGCKAGAVNDQGSELLEREEVEVTFKKPSPPSF